MKTVSEYQEFYYQRSGKARDVSRQLGFAGIAVLWVLSSQTTPIPVDLLVPVILIVTSLGLDLLQYVSATAVWGIYCRYKEKKLQEAPQEKFWAPTALNRPAIFFFWSKSVAMIVAWFFLLTALATRIC